MCLKDFCSCFQPEVEGGGHHSEQQNKPKYQDEKTDPHGKRNAEPIRNNSKTSSSVGHEMKHEGKEDDPKNNESASIVSGGSKNGHVPNKTQHVGANQNFGAAVIPSGDDAKLREPSGNSEHMEPTNYDTIISYTTLVDGIQQKKIDTTTDTTQVDGNQQKKYDIMSNTTHVDDSQQKKNVTTSHTDVNETPDKKLPNFSNERDRSESTKEKKMSSPKIKTTNSKKYDIGHAKCEDEDDEKSNSDGVATKKGSWF